MDKNKIIKMVVILASITVIAGSISKLLHRDSLTLSEYADLHPGSTAAPGENVPQSSPDSQGSQIHPTSQSPEGSQSHGSEDSQPQPTSQSPEGSQPQPTAQDPEGSQSHGSEGSPQDSQSQPWENGTPGKPEGSQPPHTPGSPSPADETGEASGSEDSYVPTGAALNGTSQLEQRISVSDDFYYEPISDKLKRYMTGISYPEQSLEEDSPQPEIGFDELRYVHILYYNFEGVSTRGELVCNEYIAQDLAEIFLELYRNEYRLENVQLIDEYDGDDILSMENNNTSCFNYRPIANSASLSMHAYGLAVDINPLYNPYISYANDGTQEVSPVSAQPYADRRADFPYKINEEDLCYKLFLEHGFIWGGNWNNVKDYQHFQKAKP